MNCLRSHNDGIEFEFVQPSAPSYYETPAPYNPTYNRHYINYLPTNGWSRVDSLYIQNATPFNDFEDSAELQQWEREAQLRRRSVYEGVHWIPVSGIAVCANIAVTRTNPSALIVYTSLNLICVL